MQDKDTKTISFPVNSVRKAFSPEQLTSYSGLSVITDFIKHSGVYEQFYKLFATRRHSASRFSTVQILSGILLASFCGVYRVSPIANFTFDDLVDRLLNLPKTLIKTPIRRHLANLGERGIRVLDVFVLSFTAYQVAY